MSYPDQKYRKGGQLQDQTGGGALDPNAYAVPILTIQSPLFKRQPRKGVALNNPDVWRKIVEAQLEHEQFLEKLGIAEEAEMKAHYDEAGASSGVSLGLIKQVAMRDDDTTKMKIITAPGIPWRKKDMSNPVQERNKVFNSFNRTGGELPKSPGPSKTEVNQPRPPSKKKVRRKEDKTLKFNDVLSEYKKPLGTGATLYPNAAAKVDTGLGQLRKHNQRYTSSGVPIVERTHHPLTIGPRLPADFGHQNYEIFRAKRAATIANVTARLHPDKPRSRNRNPRKEHNNKPLVQHSQGILSDWESIKSPSQSTHRISIKSSKPSNQIRVLRAPIVNAPSTTSTPNQIRPNAYHSHATSGGGVGPSGVHHHKPGVPAASVGVPKRRYRPSQLLPLHIPGPKYDNIYIGTYSGSESDRDSEDNMDRPVKSRKR